MPKLNGIEMCRKILNINEDQNIIITSAHNDIDYLIDLIEIGVNHFIPKPINASLLVKAFSKITKSIYYQKVEKKMQEQLEEQVKELETVINLNQNAIGFIEDGKLVKANVKLLTLLNIDSNEKLISMDKPFSNFLIERADVLYGDNLPELLDQLAKVEQGRICLKIGKFEKLFSVNLINISQTKQCLILSDISEQERTVYLDVLTGLNSREFIVDKILRLKKDGADFSTKIFKLSNYEAIKKWLGAEVSLRSIQSVANTISRALDDYDFIEEPVSGYYQDNGFIILYHPDDKDKIDKILDLCSYTSIPTQKKVPDVDEIGTIKLQERDVKLKDDDIKNIALDISTAFMALG